MAIKTEKINKFLIIKERNHHYKITKTVFLEYIPVVRFLMEDRNERKLAAIGLVERELCDIKTAADICNFHRNTVSTLLKTKRHLGIDAVLKDDRGLKKPLKYNEEIISHIKQLLKDNLTMKDEDIASVASQNLNIKVSRSAVARIRTSDQDNQRKVFTKKELIDLSQIAAAIDSERLYAQQLEMNFDENPELKAHCEEFCKEGEPEVHRETERHFLARLKQGQRCCFAGGLMHHQFLNEIKFPSLVDVFPGSVAATYHHTEILATLFHSVNQGLPSIESLKLANASEFGVLIGCSRAPEKDTVRAHLNEMARHNKSSDLIDRFACRLLEQKHIDPEVFFIDGHFLPYYGLQTIAKGYYTVRRLAMKGNEIYAVTDIQGKPLFFITESNEIDFRPLILRCVEKLIGYGIERPLLVFDREGYGIGFFKELDQKADFISWAKYVREDSLNRIARSSFKMGLLVNDKRYRVAEESRTVTESIQTAQKEGRKTPVFLKLRLVVIEDVDTKKRIGIYTSNTAKPAHTIAYYMLQRWGDSENFFKEMMARFNLDYHPGYDIKELEKQPLVENPDIPLIRKAIHVLKKEIKELENVILISEAKYMKRKDRRLHAKLLKSRAAIEEKHNDIAQFEKKLSSLPDKVSIIEILKGKPMSRCDLEKKKLYDFMQFLAFHSRERLVEIFRSCYDDRRDIKQVLDMIVSKSGYVKLVGRTLIVILDWIDYKKHREAAKCLCRLLNKQNIKLVSRLNLKLSFYLSNIPNYSSKIAYNNMNNSS